MTVRDQDLSVTKTALAKAEEKVGRLKSVEEQLKDSRLAIQDMQAALEEANKRLMARGANLEDVS